MFSFCALAFAVGYILREVGAFSYGTVNIYIASMTIVYSLPYVSCFPSRSTSCRLKLTTTSPLYEMMNYQILSRVLYYLPYHSPIHPGRMLTTMLGIATIVETLNGNGVSYWSNIKNSGGKQSMGKRFLKAALVLQLVVLICFLSLIGYFHYQCKKKGPFPKNVRGVLITLYCSSVLIGIRAIYRTVEYFTISTFRYTPAMSSSAPPIIRDEVFFWVFEALLMLANSFLFNLRNPMRFLPKDFKVYLAEDGVTEVEGPGYLDMRFFLIAMVDPFDLIGLARGRHLKRDFWKTDANLKEQGEPTVTRDGVVDKESDVEKAMGGDTSSGSTAVKENILEEAVGVDTSEVGAGGRNDKGGGVAVDIDASAATSSHAHE
jgi:hypothetical protein